MDTPRFIPFITTSELFQNVDQWLGSGYGVYLQVVSPQTMCTYQVCSCSSQRCGQPPENQPIPVTFIKQYTAVTVSSTNAQNHSDPKRDEPSDSSYMRYLNLPVIEDRDAFLRKVPTIGDRDAFLRKACQEENQTKGAPVSVLDSTESPSLGVPSEQIRDRTLRVIMKKRAPKIPDPSSYPRRKITFQDRAKLEELFTLNPHPCLELVQSYATQLGRTTSAIRSWLNKRRDKEALPK